jgi:hypothetical protein
VPNNVPQRGPWQGFFAANLQKATILNMYNPNDGVLSFAWPIMQLQEKPNDRSKLVALGAALLDVIPQKLLGVTVPAFVQFLPAQADDTRGESFWAKLNFTTSLENSVFPPSAQVPTQTNIVRQWAELSQWFPSLTLSAGSLPVLSLVGGSGNDYNLKDNGSSGPLDLDPRPTHTYLYSRPMSSVWQAFGTIHTALSTP